jgi:6-phospho-3-hexuloisomerase
MNVREVMIQITAEIGEAASRIDAEKAELFLDKIVQAERIFCAGAGRSGLMIRAFAMRLMHMGFPVHIVGDTITPAVHKGDLLIIGSGSGETESLVAKARKARRLGADCALVSIFESSSIAAHADLVVTIPAPTGKVDREPGSGPGAVSIQPKGNLFEQTMLVFFEAVVILLMKKMNIAADELMVRHANLE